VRRTVTGLLVALAAVCVVWAAWAVLRDPHGDVSLMLVGVEGEVSLRRGDDRWAVREGEDLREADQVSTAEGGRVVVAVGDETEIRIGPASSVRVTDVDRAGVSLELEDGALEATVRPGSTPVRVGSRGRAVTLSDGEVAVGVRDDLLQVSVARGSVGLEGMDVSSASAGEQVVVLDRQRVEQVPDELLFDAAVARTRQTEFQISGKAAPAARVVFRSTTGAWTREVTASPSGAFSVTLPLAEGENEVIVEVTDLLGRKTRERKRLPERDTSGPKSRATTQYGGG
jgi:FecR protein